MQRAPGDPQVGYDESRCFEAKATPGVGRRWLSRLARHLAALGAVGAIFLISLEIVSRIADPLGVSYYPETASYLDSLIIEEPIGYRNRPGLNGHFWGTEVSINALGLRNRELTDAPAEHEFRILMLGDSVVFGLGLPEEDSIPRQLERRLNLDNSSTLYTVINMGVPSYNTEQELIQLETVGFRLYPDLVLLLFSSNDLQPKMWVINRRDSMLVDLVQRSYALSLLAVVYWEAIVWITGYDSRAPYRENFDAHFGWSTVQASLADISSLCKQRGTPFVLLLPQSYPYVEAFAEEFGMPFITLDELNADLRISAINSHPNKAGAEQMSLSIYESLKERDFIRSSDKGIVSRR